MSRRERIIEILSSTDRPLDINQIAALLGLSPREAGSIYEDLKHVAKSLRTSGKVLLMVPPTCKTCGYVFKDLDRPKKPSRCPKCRSERVSSPLFIIRPRDGSGHGRS
ncbi:MAG: hypothetical protein QXE91_05300 [Thermofilaceae archaeon]